MLNWRLFGGVFILSLVVTSVAFAGTNPTPPPAPDIEFTVSPGLTTFDEDGNVHDFTIKKEGGLAGTVSYQFEGGATLGSDYTILGGLGSSGTIAFSDAETQKTVQIQCVNDNVYEGPQTVKLKLTSATCGTGTAGIGYKDTGKMLITDLADRPTASFSVQGSPMDEDGGQGTLTVTLTGNPFEPTILIPLCFEGTATSLGPNKDYTHNAGLLRTLSFSPGQTSKTVTFTAIGDDDDTETDESIVVKISIALQVKYNPGMSATLYIEQEEPPTLSNIPDVTLMEDETSSKIPFKIGDDEDPISALRVFGKAENNTLIPDENFNLYGDGADRSFRITPGPNQTGRTKGWIMVFDGKFWTSKHFIITVNGENDPPGPGQSPDPIVFDEDESDSTELSLFVSDPDNEPSEMRWRVTVKQQEESGSESVKGSAPKSLSTRYSSHYVIFGEDAPVSSTLLDTALSDSWVVIPEAGSSTTSSAGDSMIVNSLDDVNGLFVSIIRASTKTFFFGSPDFNDSEIPLIFTATDPGGSGYSFEMIVTVNPVNDAPQLADPLPDVELQDGETLKLDWGLLAYTEDVDSPDSEMIFNAVSSAHVTVALQSDTLIVLAESGWSGIESIEVIVSDGEFSDTSTCEITVISDNSSDDATGMGLNGSIPTEYALYSNYPNPFNPVTNITFALPEEAHVSLSVYNSLGQVIDILVDETRQAGYYSVQWHAGHFSSGIYFYKLETSAYQSIQRCLLVK